MNVNHNYSFEERQVSVVQSLFQRQPTYFSWFDDPSVSEGSSLSWDQEVQRQILKIKQKNQLVPDEKSLPVIIAGKQEDEEDFVLIKINKELKKEEKKELKKEEKKESLSKILAEREFETSIEGTFSFKVLSERCSEEQEVVRMVEEALRPEQRPQCDQVESYFVEKCDPKSSPEEGIYLHVSQNYGKESPYADVGLVKETANGLEYHISPLQPSTKSFVERDIYIDRSDQSLGFRTYPDDGIDGDSDSDLPLDDYFEDRSRSRCSKELNCFGTFESRGFIPDPLQVLVGGKPKGRKKRRTGGKGRQVRGKKKGKRSQLAVKTVHIANGMPDRMVQTYKYDELPTLEFNTVTGLASIGWNMNSMYILRNGGSQANIPYWNQGAAENYFKYRVVRSSIKIKIINREAVNDLCFLLAPMLPTAGSGQTMPTIGTVSTYTEAQSLPFAKTLILGPYVGGRDNGVLSGTMNLVKLYGKQYFELDAFAGGALAGTVSDPANMAFWVFGMYNPSGNNTNSTGGCTIQATMKQRVILYEPERDTNTRAYIENKIVRLTRDLKQVKMLDFEKSQ